MRAISYLTAGLILAAVAAASPAQAQVSLSVGTPGFFGAIDIGGAPPPDLVYQQPMAIQPVPMGVAPLYLYVPPYQYASWGSYCGMYNACNRPVYFVNQSWYQRVYVPHYRSHRGYYDQRRVDFERRNDIRRPSIRDGRRMAAPPSRVDNHHVGAPQQRVENRRPEVRQEPRRAAPQATHSGGNQHPQQGNRHDHR